MSERSGWSCARSCAVTGAGGYVGSRIVRHFRANGWRVRELRHDRQARDVDRTDLLPFFLEREPDERDLRDIDALVHCAYDFRPTRWDDIVRVNVDGSIRLLEAARQAGVSRVVFLSTISAFDGCVSRYGRAKLAIEEQARRLGIACVRPGLVYGDQPGGTLGALERVVSTSPIVPLVGDGSYLQYLAHEDDLCSLVGELCERSEAAGPTPIVAASDRPHSLREILHTLARRRGRRVFFVPVPRGLVFAALRIAEGLGLPVGFRSDSLTSLTNQDPEPDFRPTHEMSTTFRRFDVER